MIATMVMSIITILFFSMVTLAMLVGSAACGLDGPCQQEHDAAGRTGAATCCGSCFTSAACTGGGCAAVPPAVIYNVQCMKKTTDANGVSTEAQEFANDKVACNAAKGKWKIVMRTTVAMCYSNVGDGKEWKYKTGAKDACKTIADKYATQNRKKLGRQGETDLKKQDDCSYRSELTNNAGQTYSNKGCKMAGAKEVDDWCNHIYIVNFLSFGVFVSAMVVSIMTCCTVCCGKLDDGGGDDSG